MNVLALFKYLFVTTLFVASSTALALPTGMMGTLSLGNRTGEVDVSGNGSSGSGKTDNAAQYLGAKIGYVNLVNQGVGYILRGALNSKISGSGWASFTELRPEGNVAFGFNDVVYGFAGLNFSTYLSGFEDWGMGLGIQLGAGYMITPQVALELQYITSNYSFEKAGYDVDVTLKSLEVSVGYTF